MKHLFLFLLAVSPFVFISCEGDPGPPGEPGINILGQVFETTVDFTASNNYEQLVVFPSSIEVYESDAILVYWLEDVIPGNNGGTIDVWSPLPQTIYLNEGSFQYTFNHTFLDVLLFLQGDFDLGLLGNGFTNDQTFRIAIVPSEYGSANMSMEELLQLLEIQTSQIHTLD
jgi:hypothetical protein